MAWRRAESFRKDRAAKPQMVRLVGLATAESFGVHQSAGEGSGYQAVGQQHSLLGDSGFVIAKLQQFSGHRNCGDIGHSTSFLHPPLQSLELRGVSPGDVSTFDRYPA
jgi:hypothetical protein